MPVWIDKAMPIFMLLVVVGIVLWRLPKVDMGHAPAFRRRRFWNWFPLGMLYAFLYFGRYNINQATTDLKAYAGTDNEAFGIIFGAGAFVYGISFLINGPLTDKLGGRITILTAVLGSAIANLIMGVMARMVVQDGFVPPGGIVLWLAILYSLNMYFQSFGAVSIVKVNAQWFHVRERGVQGGVFGILISLGVYFGYDWSKLLGQAFPGQPWAIFFGPAIVLLAMFVVGALLVRDSPSKAGYEDFDTGDATEADDGKTVTGFGAVAMVFGKMLKNPVIMTIVGIEFCTGFLRNGVMSWYPKFAKATGLGVVVNDEVTIGNFISNNWGMLLCVFGIIGGMFAGIVSDRVFNSRRGPVATVLYSGITLGAIAMFFVLEQPWVGIVLIFMALNYVGVHGMLSGTASADFGGKKNTGVAVGIIDGFVYLGTGLQSWIVGSLLPVGDAARDAANWHPWPAAMIPVAIIGLLLCTRVWNATPRAAGGH